MNADTKKRYKDIDFPFTCPISSREFNQPKGLSCYVTKTLKMDHELYYDTHINHRDSTCFFCGDKGKFISISKGYRNLCNKSECVKKSFNSHSVEGFMYRNVCGKEEAEKLFEVENKRQLIERMKSFEKIREKNPNFDKERSRNCKEFWIKSGFSEEKSKSKTEEVMKEIHEKTSMKLKSNPDKYASKYPTKKEYYLSKGFTEEYAIKEISKIQNRFSLDICIKKHGMEKGVKIFKNRQEKWQKSLSENGNIKGGYSEISQVLFRNIMNFYNINEIKNMFFWTKNNEYLIKSSKSIFMYDFTDIKKKKIIEYNGDQYHANPSIYDKDDLPHYVPHVPLNKLSGNLIICSDQQPVNGLYFDTFINKVRNTNGAEYSKSDITKQIIAQSPDIILSKEFAEEIGWVDVEELALKEANAIQQLDEYSKGRWYGIIQGYNTGFNKSQELNKNKYSLEDMQKCFAQAIADSGEHAFIEKSGKQCFDEYIQSLSKSQWEIEYTKTNGKFTVTKILDK